MFLASKIVRESFMGTEFAVVGAGIGGATIGRELALQGKEVTIVEKGKFRELGTGRNAISFYSSPFWSFSPGEKSAEGVPILRTIMVGGSSMVTLGNGVRALQNKMNDLGLSLEDNFREAEEELGVSPMPENLMGERTIKLKKASEELGYNVKPMPKYIDFDKCKGCGNCVYGCKFGAKWTALDYLGEAQKEGADLITEATVDKILHSHGQVEGLRFLKGSKTSELEAENVILCAGGLGTPVILQKSGLEEAGSNFFADLLVNTYGIINNGGMEDELEMATVIDEFHDEKGFILSPNVDTKLDMFLYLPTLKKLRAFRRGKIMGMMTKIKDEQSGKVNIDGKIKKPVTDSDREKLDEGIDISKEVLIQAGCDPDSIFTSPIRGAHPGGTARMGEVVDKNLETDINGLYVSDASVLPETPGSPPVLTLVSLSKYLANQLLKK